ncbi:MAG: hypothetical protein ACU0BS_12870 [Hasllibacter sp.]
MNSDNPLPNLDLPTRWEILQSRANAKKLEASEFVERIDGSARDIDALLYRIKSNGIGAFEVIFGLSGSGKTTFVNSLPKFFDGIHVHEYPKDASVEEIIPFIEGKYVPGQSSIPVILISKRDNPKADDLLAVEGLMADLVDFFRTREGQCLVLWTVTKDTAAKQIASAAWSAGRNSVTSPKDKGLHKFVGLEKSKYRDVADSTARSLSGDGLDGFGLTKEVTDQALMDCDTIAEYYETLNEKADEIRGTTWSVLKEKIRPRLWIAVPADEPAAIEASVKSLTQGQRGRVDIDALQEWVDDPSNTANYAVEWRKIRHKMAHLFRALDVRLFEIYPNAAVSAVRAYGADEARSKLRQGALAKKSCIKTIKNTRIYREAVAELGGAQVAFGGRGNVKSATHDEYRRIQTLAEKGDSMLNRALGDAFKEAFDEDVDGIEIVVDSKSIAGLSLRPDIAISLDGTEYICIEPTWRSTGVGIEGELARKQNTLTPGYLQIYVMNKVLEYVKALGMYD